MYNTSCEIHMFLFFPKMVMVLYHSNPYIYIHIQGDAPKLAKLVGNSNNYGSW